MPAQFESYSGKVYSIQYKVWHSDQRQVGGFLWFPPPIKLEKWHLEVDITEIVFNVALNTLTLTLLCQLAQFYFSTEHL
jgi:hypothetical protein